MLYSFTSPEATLQTAGGKGANLARLTRAGFPVPRGFIISTDAYRAFVQANRLAAVISAAIAELNPEDTAQLAYASAQIRKAFAAGKMPPGMEREIGAAYSDLNHAPVAVRSSATAEDLPDLSFAGQQDTYLNIIGAEALLKAVVECWSSLWTARAIGYRMRNHIPLGEAALAVVVQEMVQSDVSGVLFTANPLTGQLSESVIDAAFGLGEALVSGRVEPDHFVVNSLSGEINEVTLGAKKVSTRGKASGGVESVEENAGTRQTLSVGEVRQLTAIGQSVQKEYGAPQDIEWAFADGNLIILQSRAITSLFPVPQISLDPLIVWFSFGAVQGLVGPITPLGRDAIRNVAAGAGRMFGLQLNPEKVEVFTAAGERLWIKISDAIRHPIGGRITGEMLEFVEPSVGQILKSLAGDPRLGARTGRLKFSTLRRLAGFFLPVLARLARNMIRPDDARARFDAAIDDYLKEAHIAPAEDRFKRLANVVAFIRTHVANALPFLLPRFIPVFGPSMGGLNLLNHLSGDASLALEVTRGLPRNVTTEMDLALWETAAAVRAEAESAAVFRETDAPTLANRYLRRTLPAAAQSALTRFMDRYGMRGVGEIDIGQPRWREDPAPVMHTLKSYLEIDSAFAPDALFARGEQAASAAVEQLAAAARRQPGGLLKERLVRAAARRVRLLMGARESPKFFAIQVMGVARKALLEAGREFVEAGTIERADDLVFLKLAELEALSKENHFTAERAHLLQLRSRCGESAEKKKNSADSAGQQNWKALVAGRRAAYERELRRRQAPRVLVSDGRAFYEGVGALTDTDDVITGSPVSPGAVEGIVHVVLDPRGARLAPGEILVCPGTDPAWTPLFMTAGGLVTEVGGMMTHGSVVAREYGIPAVVGVHQATLRLKDGQRIKVDGATGKIVILSR